MSDMEIDVDSSNHYSADERKKFLQTLYQDTSNIGHKSSNPPEMIQETKNVLIQANSLFNDGTIDDRVQNPAENYLDSQVMKATSEALIQCSQAISSEMNKYDKSALAENIKRNSDFWCFAFPYEAPPVTYLYGASNEAPTPRTPRAPRARVRQQQHEQAVPRTDSIVTDNEEDTKKAHRMYKKLKSVCSDTPMNYFEAVLDPTSFSRTVENIYHLSFMVRDGRLSVFIDDVTGLPVIKTLNEKKRRRMENSSETQFIVSMDMARWRKLQEVFKIKEPFFQVTE